MLIRLRGYAGWCAPLLFAYGIRHISAWPGPIDFSDTSQVTKAEYAGMVVSLINLSPFRFVRGQYQSTWWNDWCNKPMTEAESMSHDFKNPVAISSQVINWSIHFLFWLRISVFTALSHTWNGPRWLIPVSTKGLADIKTWCVFSCNCLAALSLYATPETLLTLFYHRLETKCQVHRILTFLPSNSVCKFSYS